MDRFQKEMTIQLIRWSRLNAMFILAGTFITLFSRQITPVLLATLLSSAALVILIRSYVSGIPIRTAANLVTVLRLLLVLLMTLLYRELDHRLIVTIGLTVLIADGIDGMLARRTNQATVLGEYLDKETDALFLHLLILILILKNLIWNWVVALGLLRYLFVIYLFITREKIRKERRFPLGRYIYVYTIISLLLSFFTFPHISRPAVLLAALALFYSFGRDFLWLMWKE